MEIELSVWLSTLLRLIYDYDDEEDALNEKHLKHCTSLFIDYNSIIIDIYLYFYFVSTKMNVIKNR